MLEVFTVGGGEYLVNTFTRIAQTAQTVKLPRRIDFSTATAHERPMELPLA